MPIAQADLKAFMSANRPDDDGDSSGGAIDLDRRCVFTQMSANSNLEIVSSNAGDTTQAFTVIGRNAAGARVTGTGTLNGTTAVAVPNGPYERILHCFIGADAAGTVTLRNTSGGTTWGTIDPGDRGFDALFDNSFSAVSGSTIRYEKIFWKNTHSTNTLNLAIVKLTADPATRIRIGLAVTKDDTQAVANRLTAPGGGVTFVDDGADAPVTGNTLEAGVAIGTWIEQNLPGGDSPNRSTYTTQLGGTTT